MRITCSKLGNSTVVRVYTDSGRVVGEINMKSRVGKDYFNQHPTGKAAHNLEMLKAIAARAEEMEIERMATEISNTTTV